MMPLPILTSAPAGSVISFKLEQLLKASLPIFLHASGMMRVTTRLQPSNAFLPISVTVEGIVIVLTWLQSAKAYAPIFVQPSGMLI
jgi:hypothetical protein